MTLVCRGVSLFGHADPLAPDSFGRSRRRDYRGGSCLAADDTGMTDRFTLGTSDGETLEARWDSPKYPEFTTVFCHPSPVDRGSMMAPLMIGVTQKLVSRGHAVLRFNFRGVGESTGNYSGGDAELADVSAAMASARERMERVGIAGWSFGAAVALNWVTMEGSAGTPYVGIAPPPDRLRGKPRAGPKRVILGSREQVIDSQALKVFCIENGIDLIITPGDHFFHGRGRRIGDLVAEGLEARD